MSPTAPQGVGPDGEPRTVPHARPWRRRVLDWFIGGIAVGAAIAIFLLLALTQTNWGREQVLAATLDALSTAVNGELRVEDLDGNILTGAKLYGIHLIGDGGEPLLRADSAFVDYRLPTLLQGDIVLQNLVVYDAELYLRRLPGDSLWNYERIFLEEGPPSPTQTPGRAIVFDQVRVLNALVVLRLPWEPDAALSEAEREQEIEAALSDTSRLMVERVSSGLLRTMRVRLLDGRLSESVYAPDERGGSYFRIDRASGTLQMWREPLEIEHMEGEVALRDTLRFRAPAVVLPHSRLSAFGTVEFAETEEQEDVYDVSVVAESLAFSDLRSIYPYLPEEGNARLRFSMETRPGGMFVRAEQLSLEAPGTRIMGEFGMVAGDTLRFVDTRLEAPELSVPTIESMLPMELPVQGLRIGEAEIRSPGA